MNDTNKERSLQVILTPPHPSQISRILHRIHPESVTGWIYLGNRPEEAMGLEELFGRSIPRVGISALLQEAAHGYRRRYIEYIGMLTGEHCTVPWLLTSLSEKNPFASSFYLSFCSIVACTEYLSTARGKVIVVCGSLGLQDALEENLRTRCACEIRDCRSGLHSFREMVTGFFLGMVRITWFASRYTARILLAHLFQTFLKPGAGRSPPEQNRVLIHAWTDGRSFTTPQRFRDIFYGDLASILSAQATVMYIIDVLPTHLFPVALNSLRGIRDARFVLQEYYLTLTDIPRAILAKRQGYRDLGTLPPLGDFLVGALVREEMNEDALSTRGEQAYLCYCAGRRIADAWPSCTYIYTFENHMWEKCTLKGVREISPQIRTVGYAHTLVYPLNLSYSLARGEAPCTPVPDLILANGEHPRDVLIEAGFPAASIHVSGALRYGPLMQPGIPPQGGDTILVAGSVSRPRTLELIHKALQALAHDTGMPVWIKCHPNLPFDRLKSLIPPLPPHFTVREEPVETLFRGTGVVLYTESTVAVEAAARGIPVIHVKLDCSLDMNVFEGLSQVPSVGSTEELRQCMGDLAALRDAQAEVVPIHILHLFGPVDPAQIQALILRRPGG